MGNNTAFTFNMAQSLGNLDESPSMEAQYKTSIWKNAIIPHMEAQYKTSIWKNAIIPHMEAQYKTRV